MLSQLRRPLVHRPIDSRCESPHFAYIARQLTPPAT
jgi:hypothetical protein